MKLLLDQNLPATASGILRSNGTDALHTREVGLARAEDRQILDWCRGEDRIVVTLDADFHALLATSAARNPSVIRIRIEGLGDEAIARLILRVVQLLRDDLLRGIAVSVTSTTIRIRSLPLVE